MQERRRGALDRRSGVDRWLSLDLPAPDRLAKSGDQALIHFLFRLVLVVATLAYFNIAGTGTLPVASEVPLNALLLAYVIIIALSFRYRRRLRSDRGWRAVVPIALDLLLISALVATDIRDQGLSPFFLLYLLAALSFGMQFGPRIFRYTMISAAILSSMLLALGIVVAIESWRLSDLFFVLMIVTIGTGLNFLFKKGLFDPLQVDRDAMVDQSTGLLNRRALFEVADSVFQHARKAHEPLTVAIAGLERFRRAGQESGHDPSDKILGDVARLMRQNVRDTDIIARLDEASFVLLFPEANLESSGGIVGRIQEEVGRWLNKKETGVSLTVGLSDPAELGYDLGSILKRLREVFTIQTEGKGGRARVISPSI